MLGRPEDYAPTIRANMDQSLGVIIADEPDCIDRWQAFAVRGRRYEFHDPLGLDGFEPPKRCVVVIFVCPGDNVAPTVQWCSRHEISPLRIRFIVHPDCDLYELFQPWYKKYDEDPVVSETTSYPGPKGVQASLGRWYNDWIYLDAKGLDWPDEW